MNAVGVRVSSSLESEPRGSRRGADANVPALLSLVTGAVSCIPFVGIVTVILAFAGICRSRDKSIGGRGMAMGGLVLGILGLGWTVAMMGFVLYGAKSWRESAPQRESAGNFLTDLCRGQVDAASLRTTDNVSRQALDAIAAETSAYGTFEEVSFGSSRLYVNEHGVSAFHGSGSIIFERAQPAFEVTMVKQGAMMYVDSVRVDKPQFVRRPATTQAAEGK